MKTAEEWDEILARTENYHGFPDMPIKDFVRLIQDDAIESAAQVCELEENRLSAGWLLAHKIREISGQAVNLKPAVAAKQATPGSKPATTPSGNPIHGVWQCERCRMLFSGSHQCGEPIF